MSEAKAIFPRLERILEQMGENIKLARLRRDMSAESLAQRADISRSTLLSIEKGRGSVSIVNYMQVLFVLGLEKDFLLLAKDDELGRKIQDAKLIVKRRSSKKST
ncbi:MAG: helix-turn-helix transcriptional regulator [Opitutales bacterium]